MLRFFITFLTATTLLAHGLFGCCWHHGHSHSAGHKGRGDAAGESTRNHAVAENSAAEHRHEHFPCAGSIAGVDPTDDDSTGNDSTGENCPADCDGERCVYVRTPDNGACDAGDEAARAVDSFGSSIVGAAAPCALKGAPLSIGVPPPWRTPLHARLHIWLI